MNNGLRWLAAPLAGWRIGWLAWLHRRQPARARLPLTHRNVYILPTRAGLALGVTLAALLLGSINYQLNLGYLLTFLVSGCALAALMETHATLRGLSLTLLPTEPGWAGRALPLRVQVDAPAGRARPAVRLSLASVNAPDPAHVSAAETLVDIAAGGSTTVTLSVLPARRGLLPMPIVRIDTRYPLGLFRAWAVWRPAGELVVAPAPEHRAPPLRQQAHPAAGNPPPRQPPRQPSAAQVGLQTPGDHGLRRWRRGDGLNLVAWKRSAQRDQLLSREHPPEPRHATWLDLATTGCATREAALARLAAWLLEADAAGRPWGLRLPGLTLPPAQGPAQRRRAMEALARC